MGFDRGFTLGLIARVAALGVALALVALAFAMPGLAAARVVALILAAGAAWLVWRHVDRTNREVARFVEAMQLGDLSARFDGRFARLGTAFDGALARLRAERETAAEELRHTQTLLDDMPVALLVVEDARVALANKAARRLFVRHEGIRPDAFLPYGAGFVEMLAADAPEGTRMLVLDLGRAQRAIVRSASLTRLGRRTRAITVEPVQEALNTVEMAAQTDIVRVLTHEILNSLTPVRSLAATAATLLGEVDDERIADARMAVATLARRTEGLGRFIESYRAVARELVPQRRVFQAAPFAAELAQLFAAEFADIPLDLAVEPPALTIDADPDLLAQAAINLLRNAADAARRGDRPPAVSLAFRTAGADTLIEVADTGAGVPEGLRRDIFLPFFTTRAEGTGVGLNLVRQIAVAHGGSVEVGDAPGGGASFRLIV